MGKFYKISLSTIDLLRFIIDYRLLRMFKLPDRVFNPAAVMFAFKQYYKPLWIFNFT
jgi:hypothetical protein